VDGGTLVVKSRLSLNMASLTLEQVAGKRKKLLVDMAAEVRKGLTAKKADEASCLVRERLRDTLDQPRDCFNVDVRFQDAVGEALKAKRSVELAAALQRQGGIGSLGEAVTKVQPLQGNIVDLSDWDLVEGSAEAQLVVEWMLSVPGGLTRLKLDTSMACAGALHKLVAKTMTLVDLDLMEEDAANLNVLQLNGIERVEMIDLSNKGLKRASAVVITKCMAANYWLTSLDLSSNELGCTFYVKADELKGGPVTMGATVGYGEQDVTVMAEEDDDGEVQINDIPYTELVEAIRLSASLTNCDVRRSEMSGDGASRLSVAVLAKAKITKFNEIPISEMRADSFAKLDLSNQNIGTCCPPWARSLNVISLPTDSRMRASQ